MFFKQSFGNFAPFSQQAWETECPNEATHTFNTDLFLHLLWLEYEAQWRYVNCTYDKSDTKQIYISRLFFELEKYYIPMCICMCCWCCCGGSRCMLAPPSCWCACWWGEGGGMCCRGWVSPPGPPGIPPCPPVVSCRLDNAKLLIKEGIIIIIKFHVFW